eukprot:scaffold192271_cov30-Prasinocladus_malaysianus.AAC.1
MYFIDPNVSVESRCSFYVATSSSSQSPARWLTRSTAPPRTSESSTTPTSWTATPHALEPQTNPANLSRVRSPFILVLSHPAQYALKFFKVWQSETILPTTRSELPVEMHWAISA